VRGHPQADRLAALVATHAQRFPFQLLSTGRIHEEIDRNQDDERRESPDGEAPDFCHRECPLLLPTVVEHRRASSLCAIGQLVRRAAERRGLQTMAVDHDAQPQTGRASRSSRAVSV
jgi:hypothetical protein